jgi:glycosyltransferase involved in cell wall biosynthesis
VSEESGVEVFRFPLRNLYWPFGEERGQSGPRRVAWHVGDQYNRQATRDLVTTIKGFKPDVVNTNNLTGFSTDVWHEVRNRRVASVHTIRDYSLLCSRGTLFRNEQNCDRRCTPCWALSLRKRRNDRSVDRVIGISSAVVERHQSLGHFVDTPSDVIHNIAAGELVAPTEPLDAGARRSAQVVFGFIGRIEPEKGIDILLASAARMGDRVRVRVAGEGDSHYTNELRQRHSDLDVEWLGRADADGFYASIDVLIVPSTWAEPMGRTVIEGAVRGVSLIHSDAGGIPEVARLAPRRAQFRAGDVDDLTSVLEEVLGDAANWRARSAVDPAVLDPFRSESVVSRNLDVFQAAVDSS